MESSDLKFTDLGYLAADAVNLYFLSSAIF